MRERERKKIAKENISQKKGHGKREGVKEAALDTTPEGVITFRRLGNERMQNIGRKRLEGSGGKTA